MSNLTEEITHRHGRDRFKDAIFIVAALLLTAVSIGSVTTKAAGKVSIPQGTVTVIDTETGLPLEGAPEVVR